MKILNPNFLNALALERAALGEDAPPSTRQPTTDRPAPASQAPSDAFPPAEPRHNDLAGQVGVWRAFRWTIEDGCVRLDPIGAPQGGSESADEP